MREKESLGEIQKSTFFTSCIVKVGQREAYVMRVTLSEGKSSTWEEALFPLTSHWVYQKDRHALEPRGQVALHLEEKKALGLKDCDDLKICPQFFETPLLKT